MTVLQRCLRLLSRRTDLHIVSFSRNFCSTSPPTQDPRNISGNSSVVNNFPHISSMDSAKQFSWFKKHGPEFRIRGEQVQIITEPRQFYEILKIKTRRARKRVTLASLYLGNGQLEKDLVACIDEACSAASTGDPSTGLEVNVLLDFTRGSRGEFNSRSMLRPIMEKWPNVKVALYHTPDLRGWLKKAVPERFNETIGLTHMKVYLFDDSFIISGANLSNDYFTNRQDRYVLFNDCDEMADFFQHLVKTVMSFSLQLEQDDSLHLAQDWNIHPYLDTDNGVNFKLAAREKITRCLQHHSAGAILEDDPVVVNNDDDYNNRYHRLGKQHQEGGEDTNRDNSTGISSSSSFSNKEQQETETSETDTVVYPLVQMGPFGVQNDELATIDLLLRSDPTDLVLLTSGYFNLTEQYNDVIVCDAEAKFKILMASPKANGFLGAKGVAGAIPYAYIYLANQFYNKVTRMGQSQRIHMLEYEREGWTFHGKGLWYYLHNESLPRLTLIGSPNFGFRSVYRDLECQVAMVTDNTTLQEQLRQEHVNLFANSTNVTAETFERADRYVPLWTRMATSMVKHFF